MKRLLILLGLAVLSSYQLFSQIPQYSVTMSNADYELLYTRDIFSDVYLNSPFTSNDTLYSGARIRFKGHSTRYYPKKAYRVRMATTQLFYGIRDLNFNAMYTDKSLIREKLAWDLFADLNAVVPFCYHANFKINSELKGLFVLIDKVDRYFLTNRGFTLGNLYNADDTYTKADLTIQPDSLLKLYYSKEFGTAGDYTDLKQLIQELNTAPDDLFAETVIQLFDTTSILNWFTVNTLTMMGDSYNKNYNLYHDTTRLSQQWIIIPWDYDLSWGRTGDYTKPYPSSLLNDGFAYTFPPLSGPSNVLKDRWMANSQLKEKFRVHLKNALDNIFTESRIHPRIDSLATLIQNDVAADPQKWGTMQDFYEHVEALKYYVTTRRNYLYKTFINPPSGNYNNATIKVTQTNVPYNFVSYDGRTIATMWFQSFSGLDSVTIYAYPDSTPPFVSNPAAQRYIKRFVKIIPHPSTAAYSAKLQFMYKDLYANAREVGIGVQDEHLLKAHWYNGTSWEGLPSEINSFANIITIENITQAQSGYTKFISAMMAETYTQKWFDQPNMLWQRLYDVNFRDYQNGFAIGEHGTFLKTTDGGANWIEKQIAFNGHFFKFAEPSQNSFFAVGEFGALYKSTDNGEVWKKVIIPTNVNLRSLRMDFSFNGWVVGDKGFSASTTDSAKTWNIQILDSTKNLFDIASFDDGRKIIVGSGGYIFVSNGYGKEFSSINSPTTASLQSVKIYNNTTIWIAGDSGTVITSTDRGSTWQNINVPLNVKLNDLHIINESSVFVVGENGKIFYTNNGGVNWYAQYSADSHDLFAVTFIDSAYGIAVGNDGTVLKTTEPGTLTEFKEPLVLLPIGFNLYQNYPNPFNSSTIIRYQLPNSGHVELKIYDLLGREVKTLINEDKKIGSYEVMFDGSLLSSGVYFYRIQVGDNFIEVKKLVLLK